MNVDYFTPYPYNIPTRFDWWQITRARRSHFLIYIKSERLVLYCIALWTCVQLFSPEPKAVLIHHLYLADKMHARTAHKSIYPFIHCSVDWENIKSKIYYECEHLNKTTDCIHRQHFLTVNNEEYYTFSREALRELWRRTCLILHVRHFIHRLL